MRPDGKCENMADGKVWIDATDEQDTQLKRISGKYEINLSGKHLEGTFLAKRHDRRRPLRLCLWTSPDGQEAVSAGR